MYCAFSVKIMRVPQAISQLSRILEVIYKPRDRALSVSKAARAITHLCYVK